MACGMVYLIVARQIDLSVGSQMAFTGMLIAFVQVRVAGRRDAVAPGSCRSACGIVAGMLLGAFQGWWTAYRGLPAFVVTLAGYLMFRGAAFLVADGQTLAPLSTAYQRIGGGVERLHRPDLELGARGVRLRVGVAQAIVCAPLAGDATTRRWRRSGPTR